MNKVLLVGNGFDLAHGLLTSYGDFLYLMQNWNEFKKVYEEEKIFIENSKDKSNVERKLFSQLDIYELLNVPSNEVYIFKRYVKNIMDMDESLLNRLEKIIEANSWVRYFCNCGAEIDGWIDFEKEIYPVIELFQFIFQSDYFDDASYNSDKIYISKQNANSKILSTCKHWDKYLKLGNEIWIEREYGSQKCGVLKKKILKSLKEEFGEFIYAFEIYLHEFVYKRKDLKLIKQIDRINADYVISFNYTLTEKLYGISEKNTHHIHGSIREDLSQGKNNMVLGVNEQEDQNLDFIYFVKYFQRIQKRTGTDYKKFLEECGYKGKGWTIDNKSGYHLHIYGHSLDVTDEDILKYVIDGAKKVYIYYYDQADYESKVINLIALYKREDVEKNIENKDIEFVETSDKTI